MFSMVSFPVPERGGSSRIKSTSLNFSSLSQQQINYLNNKSMSPSGLLPTNSVWSKIYSGIFFIDNMKPDVLKDLDLNEYNTLKISERDKDLN